MKHKKRLLPKILAFSGLILGASVVITTTVSYKTNRSNEVLKLVQKSSAFERQQTNGGEPEKPAPKPDPNFDNFKTIVENTILEEFPKIVLLLKEALNRKKAEIQANSELTKDVKLTRELYLKFFERFITKVEGAKSVAAIEGLGLRLSFPKLLSTDKSINIGSVKYRGEEFGTIGLGATNETDYKFLTNDAKIKGSDDTEIDNTITPPDPLNPEVNDITSIKIAETVKKYVVDFVGSVSSIFLNDADMPVDGIDVDLTTGDTNGVIGIFGDKPKNFNSWDDYIKEKLKLRSTAFDLKANQDYFQKESEEQPQPTPEVPPKTPDVPLPPDDLLPQPAPPVPVSPVIENIPPLTPLLNPTVGNESFGGTNFSSVADSYNNASEEEIKIKSDFNFYFYNPINTRFDYTVTRISTKGNAFIATVKISDTTNPNISRTYEEEIKPEARTFAQAVVDYNFYQRMRSQFISLYDIFRIGEKQDYSKLLDSGLRQDLFNAVFLAVKTFSDSTTFEAEKNEIINTFAENPNFKNSLTSIADFKQNPFKTSVETKSDELLTKYLEARGINTDGFTQKDQPRTFWELMGQSLELVINGFPFKTSKTNSDGTVTQAFLLPKLRQNLENESFSPRIKDLLTKNNFDIEEFNNGFTQLQKNAVRIKESSSLDNVPFEDRKKQFKKVYDGFVRFASIFPLLSKMEAQTEQTTDEEKTKLQTELTEELNSLKTYIDENKEIDSTTVSLIIVLSLLSALVAIGAITLTYVAVKRKKVSKKSYMTISISGVFAATSLALLIAMIIVLLGGI